MLDLYFAPGVFWFTIPALAATALFIIRLIVLLSFGDGDSDSGLDVAHTDSASAAEVFSVQAVLAFFMGFGWGGLGARLALDWSPLASVVVGVACGGALLAMFVSSMRGLRRLNASGNIELAQLAGASGEVTVRIPASGTGRGEVRLVLGDRERRCAAVSAGEELPSSTRVRVVAVNGDNTVSVARV
jgi:hypothetical protein